MAQVKLNDKRYDTKDCLEIRIGEKTYNMPLANCMPLKVLKKITKDADVETIINVLSAYIPEDVLDELSVTDVKAILEAWGNASKKTVALSRENNRPRRTD